MHRTHKCNLELRHVVLLAVLFLLLPSLGVAQAGDTGREIWTHYSSGQKTMAISGFVHCYRTSSSHAEAFDKIDSARAVRMIDEFLNRRNMTLERTILQALNEAPDARPDLHAERWSGPYGFATGLWWRELDGRDRQAYVQGVFWCAESCGSVSIRVPGRSVSEAVHRLNDWYRISDEDWKDPLSNARVDVPVIVAMKRTAIIAIAPLRSNAPGPNGMPR